MIQQTRLNLGCGDRYAPGWHNVDFAGSPHPKDESIDLRGILPWMGAQFIYMGHLLEHLFVSEAMTLLQRARDCMDPSGELMVVGPDVLKAEGLAVAGTLDRDIDSIKHGGMRWHGDEHRWQCTQWDIEMMLQFSGWREVRRMGIRSVPEFWPVADRGPQWQCAVSARP